MKKLFITVAVALTGFTGVVVAQQDPQFTQFMYNKLIYNPGYAGTSGAVCGVAQFRQQWVGFAGAPQSIALAADMPLKGLPLGVGLNIMNDKIGPISTTFMRAAGSYNVKIGKGKLGLGLDLGILQKSLNDTWITPEDPSLKQDVALSADGLTKTTYDIGFGAFYQIPGEFYIGLSSTHLPAQGIKKGDMTFKLTRHYYAMAGYTFKLTPWVKFTPNVLYKSDISSTSIDVNGTFMFFDKFWAGGTYRHEDAAAILMGVQLPFGPGNTYVGKVGYSYDITLSQMGRHSSGTHEIMLGVCYTPKIVKPTTHGTDRFLD
ncbi:MAG: type IX secretion system membrane protein PorP/SprF [Bacteroidetes bacterium]|nr:type IX secretion system membrane protein PorP/SprF [Bacteroidota bacterium]